MMPGYQLSVIKLVLPTLTAPGGSGGHNYPLAACLRESEAHGCDLVVVVGIDKFVRARGGVGSVRSHLNVGEVETDRLNMPDGVADHVAIITAGQRVSVVVVQVDRDLRAGVDVLEHQIGLFADPGGLDVIERGIQSTVGPLAHVVTVPIGIIRHRGIRVNRCVDHDHSGRIDVGHAVVIERRVAAICPAVVKAPVAIVEPGRESRIEEEPE